LSIFKFWIDTFYITLLRCVLLKTRHFLLLCKMLILIALYNFPVWKTSHKIWLRVSLIQNHTTDWWLKDKSETILHEYVTHSKRLVFALQLIFSGEYTKAMNKDWHSGHFCCWQCDESLTGQRYVLRDEHPYCIKCYESVFANGCEECNKIIGIDSKVFLSCKKNI